MNRRNLELTAAVAAIMIWARATPGQAAPATPAKATPAAPAKATPAAPTKATPAAPTKADIAKAKQHYIKGAQLVDDGDYRGAVREFKESYRLSRNPLLLYNVGFVYDQLDDKAMALFYFRKFLAGAPGDSDHHAHARKRIRSLRRKLEADDVFAGDDQAAPAKATARSQPRRAAAPDVSEFMHRAVEQAPPDTPLDLTAQIPPNARWRLVLAYRAQGAAQWTTTVMKRRYRELVGRIPADHMHGTTVQYYIEVKDRSGALVARAGRASSPNLIDIDPSARPQYYPDFGTNRERAALLGVQGTTGRSARFVPRGSGYLDVGSRRFHGLKWGATATAAGLTTTALIAYFVAANAAANIEAEAFKSNESSRCSSAPGDLRPCTQYAGFQRDTEAHGRRFQSIYRWTLGLGLVSGGVAGYLWYREIVAKRGAQRPAVTLVPMLGPRGAGGMATFSF